MKVRAIVFVVILLPTLADLSATTSAATNEGNDDKPIVALPYTPSLDIASMDKSIDPCEDLYTYSCGGWKKNNPIPGDRASWDVYAKMLNDNQRFLWGVLEEAAKPNPQRSMTQQKIGNYFAACMDEAAIEKLGLTPLQVDLARIQAVKSITQLPTLLGDLHSRTSTRGLLFASGVEQDARDATKVTAAVYAGGVGLPDRDYYLKDDKKSQDTRVHYLRYVEKMLTLAGEDAGHATSSAATVMRIETALAKATLTKVDQRDPYKIYHRTKLAALSKMTPHFDWSVYLKSANLEPDAWLNVSEPDFLRAVEALLAAEPLDDIKTYLGWALLNAQASYLSKPFIDERFSFNRGYLRGVGRDEPRWKKCVAMVDRNLGDALGKEFVERTFPTTVKAQTLRMTEQIQLAMRLRIEQLSWMSRATKTQALAKLAKMRNKVGYPDLWRDYAKLDIQPNDFYGNVTRAVSFEKHRQAAKIGRPVDRGEWSMTAPTVNAYYDEKLNDINFPAGDLLPPLFDPKMDDAPNYGKTGGTIGHELTHGFDDFGRQFDGDGNLHDWWRKSDTAAFEKGAQCVRDQFAQYTVVDDIKINSKLTVGEDIADLGGMIIAWAAWQEQTRDMRLMAQDGLTPEQRFFVGFAQWACENQRPANARVLALVDEHSPGKYRINGVVANMPEFARAFHCQVGKALVKAPKDVCKIW